MSLPAWGAHGGAGDLGGWPKAGRWQNNDGHTRVLPASPHLCGHVASLRRLPALSRGAGRHAGWPAATAPLLASLSRDSHHPPHLIRTRSAKPTGRMSSLLSSRHTRDTAGAPASSKARNSTPSPGKGSSRGHRLPTCRRCGVLGSAPDLVDPSTPIKWAKRWSPDDPSPAGRYDFYCYRVGLNHFKDKTNKSIDKDFEGNESFRRPAFTRVAALPTPISVSGAAPCRKCLVHGLGLRTEGNYGVTCQSQLPASVAGNSSRSGRRTSRSFRTRSAGTRTGISSGPR